MRYASLLFCLPALAAGPAFDAASVKLLSPDIPKVALYEGGPGTGDPGRLHLRVNMSELLIGAFGISADQIKGPAWLRDFSAMPFYDIVATMPSDTKTEGAMAMLQNLLAERFNLVFRREKGTFPGYELVVDKSGPRLKAPVGDDGFPAARGQRKMGWRPTATHLRIKYQESNMASFAKDLGFLMGRSLGKTIDEGYFQPRVVDKTGLTGKYTFILEYDCPACGPGPAPEGFPDIFGAVRKELGPRLNRIKDVQLDVIVVATLDKVPTAN